MLLYVLMVLSLGVGVKGQGEGDEWVDLDDYDDFDDQGRFWTGESDDLPTDSAYISDLDDQDDLDDAIVPPTEESSDIPPTSDPSPPSPPESTPTEAIPPEVAANEPVSTSVNATEARGIVRKQEESGVMVVLVMTTGTFLAVFAIYTLFSRKRSIKPSQVAGESKEVSKLLKAPKASL